MEITDELRELAGLIIEGLNDEPSEICEVDLGFENPELEWVDAYLIVRNEVGGKLLSWIKLRCKNIMADDGDCDDLEIAITLSDHRHNMMIFECSIDALASNIIHRSSQLETLFFDKYRERFISRDDEISMKKYRRECLCQKVFATKKSIRDKNKCSVCYEHTLTKTPCGHDLCLVCWAKLDKKKCPCCREDIQYRKYASWE
jgi:hypothetical protein